jgi:glycosyltransferase 2 family protein
MKRLGRVLALAGVVLAVALFARENYRHIAEVVLGAVPGLVLAGCFHSVPMIANAAAWQRLFPPAQRPRVGVLAWATWIRESVNGVLPVARVGGEIAAYRALRRHVASRANLAASLAADVALSVLSQAAFAVLGLCLLLAAGHADAMAAQLVAAMAGMLVVGGAFVFVQRAGVLGGITRRFDRLFAGGLGTARTRLLRFDRSMRAIYGRRRDTAACMAWQLAAWVAGAGEIWLALYFLDQPCDVRDAIVIEALVQAISSAAFVVPGAIGVQEGGFVLIGAVLGLDSTTSLALAASRRLRDVIVFVPGLIAWHWSESRAPRATTGRAVGRT